MSFHHRIACSVLSIIGTASLAVFAMPVHAVTHGVDGSRRTTVHYKDLDLANAGDRVRLERRIARAADKVCPYAGPEPLEFRSTCVRGAIADARHKIGLDARG
jgi:UrcA family protein